MQDPLMPQTADTPDARQHVAVESSQFAAREASGTAWLPDATPMYGFHRAPGDWELMLHGKRVRAVSPRGGARTSGRHAGGQYQLGDGHGAAAARGRAVRSADDVEPRAVDDCGMRLSQSACDGRTVRRRRHPRQATSARSVHGGGGGIRPAFDPVIALAGLWWAVGRASAWAGRVSASAVGDAEPDFTDHPPLGRLDAHLVWRRHGGAVQRPVEGRGIGLQRTGA